MTRNLLTRLQDVPIGIQICIHIVDDGSTDSTMHELTELGGITYIKADGSLFWAKSMKLAQDSVTELVDYYLWLNNDVDLNLDFFIRIRTYIDLFPESVLVGQTNDPVSRLISYGGMKRIGLHPHRLQLINAQEKSELADTFCGNIVLIPSAINKSVGGIEAKYEHGFADYDFGYRAKKMGFSIRIIPGFLGTCPTNPSQLHGLNRLETIKILSSKKYLPVRSQILFCKRHGGVIWPIYVISPYLRAVLNLKRFRSNRLSAGF
jgi:GT2 family glycosyltransferase